MTNLEIGKLYHEFTDIIHEFINSRNVSHIVTIYTQLNTLISKNDSILVKYYYHYNIVTTRSRIWLFEILKDMKGSHHTEGHFKAEIESITIQDIHTHLVEERKYDY